ncbi:MAG: nitrate reductase molybdenum cofactor assembly chaperone [Aquamicrobium sp.]|nr:nitrate reductase molybdenum cofactor assembly chaperone [Aquamicrobium sp.]
MNTVLKIVSLILSYPTQELKEAVPAIREALTAQAGLDVRARDRLERLADDIGRLDLYDAQERYVHLFDRTRSLSLHLFEHVHGESRDRGQAMVDLMQMYEAQGLEIDAKELPDYLPLFLEFLSMLPEAEAQDLLGQVAHIVAALKERLRKRRSVYAGAFVALEALAHGKADGKLLRELLDAPEDDPDDLDALDRVWQEEAVTFGGNAGENACGPDRLRTRMRAASRDAATRPTEPPAA